MATCVRNERYKAVFYNKLQSGELYDLEKDPTETVNLWDASAARPLRDEMMHTMVSRMIDTVDPIPERKCMW